MFVVTLAMAMLVGWARGGRLGRLAAMPLRWVLVLPVPFAIRAMLLHPRAGDFDWLVRWAPWLQATAYGLLVLLALANRHLPGSAALVAGTAANAVVILANGGRMPVAETAIHIAAGNETTMALARLRAGHSLTHQLLDEETRLPWLADVIPLPRPFPFPSVASAGDLLIAAALFWLVVRSMEAAPSQSPAGHRA